MIEFKDVSKETNIINLRTQTRLLVKNVTDMKDNPNEVFANG